MIIDHTSLNPCPRWLREQSLEHCGKLLSEEGLVCFSESSLHPMCVPLAGAVRPRARTLDRLLKLLASQCVYEQGAP